MKIALNIVAVIVVLAGLMWTLQGANIIGGSMMSGQSQWLYIGIVVIVAGAAGLWWINWRRRS